MDNLARVIELWTKIPASRIREDEFRRLSELDKRLKEHIVGQDEAVELSLRRYAATAWASRPSISR